MADLSEINSSEQIRESHKLQDAKLKRLQNLDDLKCCLRY